MDTLEFADVRVIIWDFDGTLYRQVPALWEEIRASEIRVIQNHTGWTEEKAKEEFYKLYKVVTPSGTKAVAMLSHINPKDAALEGNRYIDYANYLQPDPKLTHVFSKLSGYTHYLLVNGTTASVTKGLSLLGLTVNIFAGIVTSEIVGETKPGTKGFQYILERSGQPAGNHLMVGDREDVDLVPAKKLGMHTCLVWSNTPSAIADMTLPTVYEISGVLV